MPSSFQQLLNTAATIPTTDTQYQKYAAEFGLPAQVVIDAITQVTAMVNAKTIRPEQFTSELRNLLQQVKIAMLTQGSGGNGTPTPSASGSGTEVPGPTAGNGGGNNGSNSGDSNTGLILGLAAACGLALYLKSKKTKSSGTLSGLPARKKATSAKRRTTRKPRATAKSGKK